MDDLRKQLHDSLENCIEILKRCMSDFKDYDVIMSEFERDGPFIQIVLYVPVRIGNAKYLLEALKESKRSALTGGIDIDAVVREADR